jgi:hypothetical protein
VAAKEGEEQGTGEGLIYRGGNGKKEGKVGGKYSLEAACQCDIKCFSHLTDQAVWYSP